MPPIATIAAPADPGAIPLYRLVPRASSPERWNRFGDETIVRNVSRPTITPFLPDPARATGAAVIVLPGGAFQQLSMDNEGWPVARWLAAHGIAAFVLKYRLNPTPNEDERYVARLPAVFASFATKANRPTDPQATDDAVAALKLVRSRGREWGVDSERVGMLGFSAGAITALNATVALRDGGPPSFIGYVYGPMEAIDVPPNAPPMFAALATNDPLFGGGGFGIVDAWIGGGHSVELHAYERGGHGFGMGATGTTTTGLMDQFYAWLQSRGVVRRP